MSGRALKHCLNFIFFGNKVKVRNQSVVQSVSYTYSREDEGGGVRHILDIREFLTL